MSANVGVDELPFGHLITMPLSALQADSIASNQIRLSHCFAYGMTSNIPLEREGRAHGPAPRRRSLQLRTGAASQVPDSRHTLTTFAPPNVVGLL
jgi:hypothetical protein